MTPFLRKIFRVFIAAAFTSLAVQPALSQTSGQPQIDYAIIQFDYENKITIDAADENGLVNRGVLGTGLIGDAYSEDDGFMNYGGGIYDPNGKQLVSEVVDLAKNIGVSYIRFPGGSGADTYDWKRSYWEDRTEFLFGIDEFMKACEEIGAEPIYTLSYFLGDENDAADLVEYLNAPADGSNPNGGTDWAQVRANKGHHAPYGVKYFELGNEVFNGHHSDGQAQVVVEPENYANDYLIYKQAMRAVDPTVELGLSIDTMERNRIMFEILQDQIDFVGLHSYPNPGVTGDALLEMDVRAVFLTTFVRPHAGELIMLRELQETYKEVTGLTESLPIFITEYNADFKQDNPVPYRHTLGTALLIADIIRTFMDPVNNVQVANQHYFANEYWGMVKSATPYRTHDYNEPIIYAKRPTYYIYELYKKNFGDILLKPQVSSFSYQLESWLFYPIQVLAELFLNDPADPTPVTLENPIMPYITVNASKSQDGNFLYLMVVNRNPNARIPVAIDIRNFGPIQDGHAWILNGDNSDSTTFEAVNEENPFTVRLKHVRVPVSNNVFEYTFERHSVTSMVLSVNNMDDLWVNNDIDESHRLEAADGKVYTYNPDGTLTIEHPQGGFWEVQIFNTDDGNMIWGKDSQGLTYTPNGDGTFTAVRSDGQHLLYDGNFNLIGIIDANGTVFNINADGSLTGTTADGTTYHYTSAWKIISIEDPQGNTNYFGDNGQVIRRVDNAGTEFIFKPDGTIEGTAVDGTKTLYSSTWETLIIVSPEGKPVLTKQPDGTICDWNADGSRRCRAQDGAFIDYAYDGKITLIIGANGLPVMVRDPDGRVTYFDGNGKVVQSVDPAGNIFIYNADGTITGLMTNGYTVIFTSAWQVISVTPPA
jgi:alpha-L-arabinofuranosidase